MLENVLSQEDYSNVKFKKASIDKTPIFNITQHSTHSIISDTGNSSPAHCITEQHAHLLTDLTPFQHNAHIPHVELPNGTTLAASHFGYINIPSLPLTARLSYVFPDFAGRSLLSIPTLCEHDCVITYDKHHATVNHKGIDILHGTYDRKSRQWLHNFTLPHTTTPIVNNVITHRNQAECVRWFHAAFSSTPIPTLKNAISKQFIQIPGLTTKMLEQNEPISTAMHEGHLRRARAGIRSTKDSTSSSPLKTATDKELFLTDIDATDSIIASVISDSPSDIIGSLHADATGRFPIASSRGTQYYLIFHDERTNFIHVEPMRDRSSHAQETAFESALIIFRTRGALPPILRIDNEMSASLVTIVKKKFDLTIERAPPQNHRTLRAERAIQTWKSHFISTICTAPDSFPLLEHDRLVPYAVMTLNLLRESRTRPGISAWEHLHGKINWNGCIFAPPGIAVIAFEPKDKRGTWGTHGKPAFYLGPATDTYRCINVYIPSTNHARTTDTVAWLPEPFHLPGSSSTELVAAAIQDLCTTLTALHEFSPAYNIILPQLLPQLDALRLMFAPAPILPQHDVHEQRVTAEPASPPVTPHEPPENSPVTPATPTPTADQRVDTVAVQVIPPPPHLRHQKTHRRKKPISSPPLPTILSSNTPQSAHLPTVGISPIPRTDITKRTPRTHRPNARYASELTTLIFEKDPATHHLLPFPTLSSLSQLEHPPPVNIVASATHAEKTKYLPPSLSEAHVSNDVLPTYHTLRHGPDGLKWENAHNTAIYKLIDTGTIKFIPWDNTQKHCYFKAVCKEKTDDNGDIYQHVRGTAADTNSEYDGPTAANTAGLSTVKILLNSVVSTPGARFCTADIKDYYLGTPMDAPAYMSISMKQLSEEIKSKFNLQALAHNNQVMIQINKGMYGLTQAGRLAQDRLIPHLAQHDYIQSPTVPMLFKHKTRPIAFTLIVDDFGIKYINVADVEHLFTVLRKLYVITTDMTGSAYIGLTIRHDLQKHTIKISIPGYVRKAITRFAPSLLNTTGKKSPMQYHPHVYGSHVITALEEDSTSLLTGEKLRRLQGINGTFLYYARALDITAAFPVAKLASLPPSTATEELAHHFLQYMVAHPNACVTFFRSDMQHNCHSDASFNGETRGRSRASGVHYLGHYDPARDLPPNGFIEYVTTIIDVIVASAAEAELAAIFINGQIAVTLRHALEFLGHPQGPSCIVSDNLVGVNILNGVAKSKRSRSMDLRCFWIKDRIAQNQYKLSWAPGTDNLADYLTKIHPVKEYVAKRSSFVSDEPDSSRLQ